MLSKISGEKKIDVTAQVNFDLATSEIIIPLPVTLTAPITAIEFQFHAPFSFTLSHVLNYVMTDSVIDKVVTTKKIDFRFDYPIPIDASHIILTVDQNLAEAKKVGTPILKVSIYVLDVDEVDSDKEVVTPVIDRNSLAYGKPTRSPYNQENSKFITDGNQQTAWSVKQFPAYVDIDLLSLAKLTAVEVYFTPEQQVQFNLYGSSDGHKFKRLQQVGMITARKKGERYYVDGQYRYLRLLILASGDMKDIEVRAIRVLGQLDSTSSPVVSEQTKVAAPIFKNDGAATQAALAGIIYRRLGAKYVNWFHFESVAHQGQPGDEFELSHNQQQIVIRAATGVTMAAGLNYYLKKYCQVNITQAGLGDQVQMPPHPIFPKEPEYRITKATLRYAYNYTTHAYTMAFWQADEWQKELDWLALNGVNLVLDTTGLELVWYHFLQKIGYQDYEISDFLTGPTYTAWQWMGNMTGFGGPIDKDWAIERGALAQRNHQFMYAMGMQPVIQAYSGLVPNDIQTKLTNCPVIPQGQWCGFARPNMVRTDSQAYVELAKQFYTAQQNVYGKVSHYYAVDPFHEGGNQADLALATVARQILNTLLNFDQHAIWVLQSWQENPAAELLVGIREKAVHVLVLDLYAERTPHWSVTDPKLYGGREFGGTPWVYCMLNNFGGRMGLSGHLDTLQNNYLEAVEQAHQMRGIGITPEASQSNPLLFDFFFDLIWHSVDQAPGIDVSTWLVDYCRRRYGQVNSNWQQALEIMTHTVYASKFNQLGQGAPESILNARPGIAITTASTWGNAIISYPNHQLLIALKLLRQPTVGRSTLTEGYQVDLVILAQQVLANSVQGLYQRIVAAIKEKKQSTFKKLRTELLQSIILSDHLASQLSIFRLATWQKEARQASARLDDFSQDIFNLDALLIVSTWGSRRQADSGGLHDYANRQWSGLTAGLYYKRWQLWLTEIENNWESIDQLPIIDWFKFEWLWAINQSQASIESEPHQSMMPLIDQVITRAVQFEAQPIFSIPAKQIKLIAVDMDGTFLDDHKQFNQRRFQELLAKMKINGQHFVVASGNQYQHLLDVFAPFGKLNYIAENGAKVQTGNQLIWQQTIPANQAQAIIKVIKHQQYFKSSLVVLSGTKDAYVDAQISDELFSEGRKYYHHLTLVDDLCLVEDDFYKIALAWPGKPVQAQFEFLKQTFPDVAIVSSGFEGIDIIPKGINKARGIQQFADLWGLKPNQIAVFGDSNNDLEMLQATPFSFAMINGNDEAKLAANYITRYDNNHEGVLDILADLV